MAHVFISYNREDGDFAEVVQAKLERAGHTTSIDLDVLDAGDDWQDRLDDAIRDSQALIVIMTPEARASEHVAYEWAFALGAGVRVIPLELKQTSFSPRLAVLHRLDFMDRSRPWDTLFAEVEKAGVAHPRTSIVIEPGAPAPVRDAVRALDSLDAEERLAAIKALAGMDHPSTRSALVHACEHTFSDVRVAACVVQPDCTEPRIVPGLLNAWDTLTSNHQAELVLKRAGILRADFDLPRRVARIGAPAVPYLLECLRSASARQRPKIIDALGVVGDASLRPVLLEALGASDPETREAAAAAIGHIGDAAAASALLPVLADSHGRVRAAAACSLGLMKVEAAVPALLRMLDEDTPRCRSSSARALGQIGDRSALAALIRELQEDNHATAGATIEALDLLGDVAAVAPMRRRLEAGPTERITEDDGTLMTALLRLGDTESLPLIENRLVNFRSGTSNSVTTICELMTRLGDAGISTVIRVMESANRSEFQRKAAAALEAIDTPQATTALGAWKRVHG